MRLLLYLLHLPLFHFCSSISNLPQTLLLQLLLPLLLHLLPPSLLLRVPPAPDSSGSTVLGGGVVDGEVLAGSCAVPRTLRRAAIDLE